MVQPKVWFVTGASRGFGRIWTEAALRRGDRVAATARDLNALDDLVGTHGDSILALSLDVTDRDAVFEAVRQAHRHFGRLDVILCNAGYGYMGAIEEVAAAEAKTNFDTNVFGTLSVIQAALPLLRAQRSGHILTVSSIGGVIGFPTGGIYVATKFAVEGMTEALAGEVAGFGIKVTIIEPGSFATGFRSSMKAAPAMAEYEAVRQVVLSALKPEMSGDPLATAASILKVVDADKPPLRLLLGAGPLPMIKKLYEGRLATWDQWAEVSNAAQGDRAAQDRAPAATRQRRAALPPDDTTPRAFDLLPGRIDAAAAGYVAERAAPLDARAQKPPRRQQKAPPLSAMNEIKARRNAHP